MEYCPGGSLYDLLKQFPQQHLPHRLVVFYAASITIALSQLHANGVIHRDVKPENVLLDGDGFIRLADFGLAHKDLRVRTAGNDGRVCRTFCGTVDYYAPEILTRQGYSYAVDMWSFGCLVYELLTGLPPFHSGSSNRAAVFNRILKNNPQFPVTWSPDTIDFVSRLLIKKPSERLGCGAHGMQELLDHRFFRGVNWDGLMHKRVTPPFRPRVVALSTTSTLDGQTTGDSLLSLSCSGVERRRKGDEGDQEVDVQDFAGFDWCSPEELPVFRKPVHPIARLDVEKSPGFCGIGCAFSELVGWCTRSFGRVHAVVSATSLVLEAVIICRRIYTSVEYT